MTVTLSRRVNLVLKLGKIINRTKNIYLEVLKQKIKLYLLIKIIDLKFMEKKEDFKGFNKDEYVPILRDESISFLYDLAKKLQPKTILEIGTYIGYSASILLSSSPNCTLDTVEIKEENANLARENLKNFGERAKVFCQDAKDFIETKLKEKKKYDFIFLDGPKGQYIRYLPILKELLESGGVLVADNVYFHGMVKMEGKIPHKHRSIVNNLRQFINEISIDSNLQTTIYDIGDGISVSYKN